jgi:hypothetical protein
MLSPIRSSRWVILGCLLIFGFLLILGTDKAEFTNRLTISGSQHSSTKPSADLLSGECSPWEKVNTNAFGLSAEVDEFGNPVPPISETPFLGEEGFEVLVFRDQLYLGMEADNALGARLWRTRRGVRVPQSQLDWEEVAADENGLPFGISDIAQADHIDSLAAFQDWIFASTANRSGSPKGTLVFRSRSGDPGSWEDALAKIGPGFGKPQNENFKDIQVFDGQLCGGTWNEMDGAEVWCTLDGENWTQKNVSGFGETSNMIIWSGHVFDGQLYFGVQNVGNPEIDSDDEGRLFRTASLYETPEWEEVFRTQQGDSWGNILGDLDGYLYISTPSEDGMLVYRSSSGDRDSWEVASLPGFDQNPKNLAVLADGAAVYKDALYAGVVNGQKNFTLWRTHGVFDDNNSQLVIWEQIPMVGMDDPYNIYVQLVQFNGALYAWTSNPVSGQQVWRTLCEQHE